MKKKKLSKKKTKNKLPYVMVRTYAMGVFAGELDSKSTETVKILRNARRIYYWTGAATLSELSVKGTCSPDTCKFPVEVPYIELTSPQGFEMIQVSQVARESIRSVKIWTAENSPGIG